MVGLFSFCCFLVFYETELIRLVARRTKVSTRAYDDEDDASAAGPGPRGWISSGTMGDLEENGIVIWGGLDDGNKRLGDGWIFRLG